MRRFERMAAVLIVSMEGLIEGWWYCFKHQPKLLEQFPYEADFLAARKDAYQVAKKLAFIEEEFGQEAVEGAIENMFQRALKQRQARELEAAGQGSLL